MEEALFAGREVELQMLRDLLLQGAKGQGSVVFVEGHVGMGKTALLTALQEQCRQFPKLKDTMFVWGECYPEHSSQDAYQPFADILGALSQPNTKRDVSKAVLSILEETGPDWLRVIPGLGPALAAGFKTATLTRQRIFNANDDKHAELSKVLVRQYVDTITEIASAHTPLALIIKNAQWLDSPSCELLARLAYKAPEHRLVVFVTYRPSYIDKQHPLHGIVREMKISQLARVVHLSGWNEDEIRSYLRVRYGGSLNPALSGWLHHLTEGHPLFVSQYLSLLEQASAIREEDNDYILEGKISHSSGEWKVSGKLEELDPPDSIEEVLKQRIERLVEEDRRMLEMGSVQGRHFMSSILVDLLNKDEIEVLSRLGEIEKQHRIITYYPSEEWLEVLSDLYAFEHLLMQQQFYRRVSEPIRIRLHRRIGEALEHSLREQADAPRKLILDIARHYDVGRKPLLAARYYYLAAQSSFSYGAFTETIELCQQALRNVRTLTEGVIEHERLRVEVILLLLMSSEARWRGKPEVQGELHLAMLIEEAEGAASRTGDQALLAQSKFLKGKTLIATHSLAEAVAVMKEALDIARNVGDPLLEFAIMPHLGNVMNAENLAAGVELQYQAYDLYHAKLASKVDLSKTDLDRHFYHLQGYIGVGEFDRGNFDEAIDWIEGSIAGLKRLKMRDDLPRRLNYLGQVYTAMGLFENAETTLNESIELFKDEEEPSPWKGYNLALLGKLYLEWLRIEDAVEPLRKGWEETKATWMVDLVALVRNYYIELLMHPDYKDRDLAKADRLLNTTVEESKVSCIHHSVIAALSLRARLALMQEHVGTAVAYSTEAVEHLQKFGTLPALREEEIFFNHYVVLEAAGQSSKAHAYLNQAHTVLQQKALSIKNREHQRAFMERVPVSQAILSALNAS